MQETLKSSNHIAEYFIVCNYVVWNDNTKLPQQSFDSHFIRWEFDIPNVYDIFILEDKLCK